MYYVPAIAGIVASSLCSTASALSNFTYNYNSTTSASFTGTLTSSVIANSTYQKSSVTTPASNTVVTSGRYQGHS